MKHTNQGDRWTDGERFGEPGRVVILYQSPTHREQRREIQSVLKLSNQREIDVLT